MTFGYPQHLTRSLDTGSVCSKIHVGQLIRLAGKADEAILQRIGLGNAHPQIHSIFSREKNRARL